MAMRSVVLGSLGVVALCVALGCSREEPAPAGPTSTASASPALPAASASATASAIPRGEAEAVPPRPSACDAPSTRVASGIDARREEDVASCHVGREGGVPAPVAPARLDEAVLAFDAETLAHVRTIAARGRTLGREPRAFGLVGDSITVSPFFLDPFGKGSRYRQVLSPAVHEALAMPTAAEPGRTIVDFYRGAHVDGALDAFRALRAAKVGARSDWALPVGRPSPVAAMIDRLSPSIAFILFGTNDAAYRVRDPEALGAEVAANIGRIAELLERRGVVPVLSTLPRHEASYRGGACDVRRLSPWRIVVQTNAISAAVAALACERHLPLVDLRHAFDALGAHGVGRDGIHPSAFAGGPGKLTEEGLGYGWNARSYVTLRMLKQIALAADLAGDASALSATEAATTR
jgi:hypothetical protein